VTGESIVVSHEEAGVPDQNQDVLDRETAQRWIARWEIQQQGYLPDR
jgi:hypothetical protein